MIFHSVFFKLKHPKGAVEEGAFLEAAQKLADIQGVGNFQILRQTSVKNNFDYGLLMEFAGQQQYDDYSNHPDHGLFIEEFWLKDVVDFLEIDYERINLN